MGEWSEYFEDFPEENPANWVGDRYLGPDGARQYRLERNRLTQLKEVAREQVAIAQQKLNHEIAEAIRKGNERRAAKASRDE